jgi:hypothetical protein
VIGDADQIPDLADATVPTRPTLEFDAFAYASALANCSVAGQGFHGWRLSFSHLSAPNKMSVCLEAILAGVRDGDTAARGSTTPGILMVLEALKST